MPQDWGKVTLFCRGGVTPPLQGEGTHVSMRESVDGHFSFSSHLHLIASIAQSTIRALAR